MPGTAQTWVNLSRTVDPVWLGVKYTLVGYKLKYISLSSWKMFHAEPNRLVEY